LFSGEVSQFWEAHPIEAAPSVETRQRPSAAATSGRSQALRDERSKSGSGLISSVTQKSLATSAAW
jgi:hypothetical protein